jgi:hypothetical protein
MQSSAEVILANMEILYENIFNLLSAFQQASNSPQAAVSVTLKNKDGSTTVLPITSFQSLQNDITRIDANFRSLTNANNIAYTLAADGTISQYTKTTFMNAEYLSGFAFGTGQGATDANAICVVDNSSLLKELVFPNVKIPIYLENEIKSPIRCRYYDVTSGWSSIPANVDVVTMEFLMSQGTIVATKDEVVLELEREQIQSYGTFAVTSAVMNGNVVTCIFGSTTYKNLFTTGTPVSLKVGDLLVTPTGASQFQITTIDLFTGDATLTRVGGTEALQVGAGALQFNQVLANPNQNIVGVPVTPNKQFIVFLSTENLDAISFPSVGIPLDTSTYQVTAAGTTYTLDEYFSTFVTNFSDYIFALIQDTSIPLSLGIAPAQVILDAANFTVIQTNSHITDASITADINSLNAQKQKIQTDINYQQTQINTIQNQIDAQQFTSVSQQTAALAQIQSFKNAIAVDQQNLLAVAAQLDADAVQAGIKGLTPEYAVLGFWPIQPPIFSPQTKAQNIIGYNVQYRYLSASATTVQNTSLTMISNGQPVNVVFSSWNQLPTRFLQRVSNADGTSSWETPVLDSVDDININQANIALQAGESVEIRVQAVSEAGYPIASLTSPWSAPLRVDFPTALAANALNNIVSQNATDLQNAQFQNILATQGLLKHIAGQINEGNKTFMHSASDIASGFYSPEQNIIDLQSLLTTIQANIAALQNATVNNNITVQVTDFDNEQYQVNNNSTIELSAGNYSDSLNLLDNTKWGSIIRLTGSIIISNNNTQPIEIKTLVPGSVFDSSTAGTYYNVPVRTPNGLVQNSKQILYFRNLDITNQSEDLFKLVMPKQPNTNTFPNSLYINTQAAEPDKNVVFMDSSNNVLVCKLFNNAGTDFVAFTTENPLWSANTPQNMVPEFNRETLYTSNVKALQYQSESINSDTMGLGFADNDFFAIGENTCGAFLYPIFSNIAAISVIGSNTTSTLILGANSQIVVPFRYEFRMMDRFGKVNGLSSTTINDTMSYTKKVGIDMLLNNQLFKFDINVTSNLKSNVTPIPSLNVSSVTAAFNNETPNTPS